MSDTPHPMISRLKRELDELRIQVALGRVEAFDFLEEQKAKLKERVDEAKKQVERNPMISEETAKFLKGRLDELRLQLALGKMQSRAAVEEQLPKITKAMDLVKESMAPVKETAGEAFRGFYDGFDRSTDRFRSTLDALGEAFGLSEKRESGSATGGGKTGTPEEAKVRQVERRLDEVSDKAKQVADFADEELDKLAQEVSETFAMVRSRLREITGSKKEP